MNTTKIISIQEKAALKKEKFWNQFWFWAINLGSLASIIMMLLIAQLVNNNYSQYWGFISIIIGLATIFYNKHYETKFRKTVEETILKSTGNSQEILRKIQNLEDEKIPNNWSYKLLVLFNFLLFVFLVILFILDQTTSFETNLKLSDEIEIISSISLLTANHLLNLKINPKKIQLKLKENKQKIKTWTEKHFHHKSKD